MASLETILAATRRRLVECRSTIDARALDRLADGHRPRGFQRALEQSSSSSIAVIAELKKASPSRGLIAKSFDPAGLARDFEGSGAAALSVVTDEEFFQGSLKNLRVAAQNTRLPCLRKDFIVDEWQVLEARAHSADALLLIVAALSQAELIRLARRATELGLDVLTEVHDERELERALDAGLTLIGVNSRDLRTFRVDLGTAFRLAEQIPRGVLPVAESGIESAADIARLRAAGYRAFLIGETLMKAPAPGEALKSLLAEAACQVSSAR
jgi:indole-3-glycerol phosphate synthase